MSLQSIENKKMDSIRSFKIERVVKIVSNGETLLNPKWQQIKNIKGIYSVEFIKANGDLRNANCINLTEEYSKGVLDTSNDKTNGVVRFLDMGLTMDKGLKVELAQKLIINSLFEEIEKKTNSKIEGLEEIKNILGL